MSRLPFQVKLILVFGGAGFFLSFFAGLLAGVSIGTCIFRAIIFFMVFSFLGFGFFILLEKKIPELLIALKGEVGEDALGDRELDSTDFQSEEKTKTGVGGEYHTEGAMLGAGLGSGTGSSSTILPTGKRKDDGNFGDHIIVEGVRIENEPKIMADAIRHVLSKDEE